ncbi:MAG: S9 family peptidase [Saprospiraceae bacterium]|nr:S9 family peptidase [Saprospiraceae bacterium]
MKSNSLLSQLEGLEEPLAPREDTVHTIHEDDREDPYYWLKNRGEQRVIDYLNKENTYREKAMAHLADFQDDLYTEMKSRIKEDDETVPYFKNGYFYLRRYKSGKEYPVYSRKKGSLDAEEEVMLDVNRLAESFSYYAIGGRSVSPNNNILAFGEDTLSRRIYKIRFKDLSTGNFLDDEIPNTTGKAVWANDNRTVFYSVKDETLRSYKIFRHVLGTPVSEDAEVYHEKDPTFRCFVSKSKSERFLIISSHQTITTEYRYLDANDPSGEFQLFHPRERDHIYHIAHFDDHWYIRSNWNAPNFKLMKTDLHQTNKAYWSEFITHRKDVLLEGTEIFKEFIVLSERFQGTTRVRVKAWTGQDHIIDFNEEAYMAYPSVNYEYDTPWVRLFYTSLTTPRSVIDYNMETNEKVLKKEQEVLGDFSKEDYVSERQMVKTRDGQLVPVSIVYHKDYRKNGTCPLLLYGYGSYGASMDPYFSSIRLSLLDRGFAFAIAHIRGGQEMGRHWYEEGKLLKKKNTFYDFIDCGKYLIDDKYCAPDQLYAMGGSAGGLLMGAVINEEPEMWAGVVAAVPFVDVITTMLDESIPLTTGEYDEWGNPREKLYYDYMKTYSPYDNVSEIDYPPLLVTTGYHDSQVQYWEPAKWVAKMRVMRTNKAPLLLYCNMETGHGGASGRFEQLKEIAMEYAFLLDLAGKTDN